MRTSQARESTHSSPEDVPAISGTHPDRSEDHDDYVVERSPDDTSPFSALAFKVMTDPFVGQLTFIRVYSGVMKTGTTVFNPIRGRNERIGRLLKMHANKREEIQQVYAGDIAAAVGLKSISTGDTICDPKQPVVLESMEVPAPVISLAIEPKTKADQEKLGQGLSKLTAEDPTFQVRVDSDTNQTVISGMGELHLEVLVDRMRREFSLDVDVSKPQVAFKETITKTVEHENKYVKQSGGRGQYGHVVIKVEPREPGSGFEFINKIVGGAIPKEFIPAVQKGVVESMARGILCGYPAVDISVTLLDGSFHDVDSSEMAFKICASMAFQEACRKGSPQMLEPVMDVEVVTPEEFMGDVIGRLNSKRGKIKDLADRAGAKVVRAEVPLSGMFGYSTDLRSATQGRASYSMEFAKYDAVPASLAEELIAKSTGSSEKLAV